MKKWEKFSREEIEEMILDSSSIRDLAQKLGYSIAGGGSISSVKEMILELGLDTSHFLGQGWNKNNFDYSRFRKDNAIKSAVALPAITQLRGWKCEQCGLDKWREEKIPLEVHHLDGDRMNNELSNLQLLCPNCHALTENWRGKILVRKIKILFQKRFLLKH